MDQSEKRLSAFLCELTAVKLRLICSSLKNDV